MNDRDDMNDTDVLSAVRDSLSGTPVVGPPDVEAIMARGRAHRRRALIPGVAGTLAVAAGVALAVNALTPAANPATDQASGQTATHQASGQPAALAAWTVTKLADGNISVTVRELKDPAGLQSTLRSDGVAASVTFASAQNPVCRPYPGGTPGTPREQAPALLKRVFPKPYDRFPLSHPQGAAERVPADGSRRPAPPRPSPSSTIIVINPSALPGNAGVQIGTSTDGTAVLMPRVVYASAQCTGS